MKKKNNPSIILTSMLCLLPILMSLVVYGDLPDRIAVHWDSAGNPNGFLSKELAAFGLPFLFVVLNIFSRIKMFNDPKRENVSNTMQMIVLWMIPLLSLVLVPVTLFIAMGVSIPISTIAPVFAGMLLIVCGNYLPKSRQNYVVGIKLPWTLHNADNWNKTHRLAGYSYIIGGFFLITLTFVSLESTLWSAVTIAIMILLVVIPFLYSYLLYKKDGGSGGMD